MRPARFVSSKNELEALPSAEALIRRRVRITTASNRSLPGLRTRQAGAVTVRQSPKARFSARQAEAPRAERHSAAVTRARLRSRVGMDQSSPHHHWLAPGDAAVALEDAGADVAFVAADLVGCRAVERLAQDRAAAADELDPVLRVALFLHDDRHRGAVRAALGQLDAGRGVEIPSLHGREDRARRQFRRAHHDPSASGTGQRRIPRILEMVRIVDGDAVEQQAAREDRVPGRFSAADAAAPEIVDHRVAVVDLEQLVVADALQIVGRERPCEVGMIDVRHRVLRADRVDAALQDLAERRSLLPADPLARVEAVDVNGLSLESARDFFTRDQQETSGHGELAVEHLDAGADVVVAQHQEVVAVVLVPSRDVARRAVAVALQRVRVRVALEPSHLFGFRLTGDNRGPRKRGHDRGQAHP